VGASRVAKAAPDGYQFVFGSTGSTGSTADVFDDHLLAEDLRQPCREHSSDRIGRAAGGVGNDHGYRPGRPILSRGVGRRKAMKRNSDRDRMGRQGSCAHLPSLLRSRLSDCDQK
jgi:hypothetical protein